MSTAVETPLAQYVQRLQEKVSESYSFQSAELRPVVEVDEGRKYYKLVVNHHSQRMVHCFVDRVTGDVFKPEGWAKPAKGARYNLVTGLADLLAAVNPYGGYLYQR